ncbi:MAG: leucyl/phenylalanyl-tRNA--protein transferase [Chitinophagales bacterium]
MPVWQLNETLWFPEPQHAEADGLLAIGADLSAERLLLAYRNGIFPWFNLDDEIFWFSPDPRCVLFPDTLNISRSMQKMWRQKVFTVRMDTQFETVMRACATVERKGTTESWIDETFIEAYVHLHTLGYAHSIEVYAGEQIVGGLYGVALGGMFFGESMFSYASNASKFALIALCSFLLEQGFTCIDCQVYNAHLGSLGATDIPREKFLEILQASAYKKQIKGSWTDKYAGKA